MKRLKLTKNCAENKIFKLGQLKALEEKSRPD